MEQLEPKNDPKIREIEARILVFLGNADKKYCFLSYIVKKLAIDYSYAQRTLTEMVEKQWIGKEAIKNRIHYRLTNGSIFNQAKNKLLEMKGMMLDKLTKSYNEK